MSKSNKMENVDVRKDKSNNWRVQNGSTHLKRFSHFICNGFLSDIDFIVGKEKCHISAHKLVLMIGSPFFQTAFSRDEFIKEFNVSYVEPEVFKLFLQFMYTGECSIKSQNILPMLNAATIYNVPDLARICELQLKTILTPETSLTIFQQAVKYNNKELEEDAIKYICQYAYKIVETDEFLNLESNLIKKLLMEDDLAIYDEIQIFDALIRWAEAECRRQNTIITPKYCRSVLENLIPYVRFSQMDPSDFSLKVATRDILLTEEMVSVLLYYNIPIAQRSTTAPRNSKFNINARKYFVRTTNYIVKRLPLEVTNVALTKVHSWHRICFKVDTAVWMTSIGFNKIYNNNVNTTPKSVIYCQESSLSHQFKILQMKADENRALKEQHECNKEESKSSYMVQVRLEDYDLETIYAKKNENVHSQFNTNGHYHVTFDKPVKILENTLYTASLQVQGDYIGTNYTRMPPNKNYTAEWNGKKVKFEFSNAKEIDLDNPTNFQQGQMAALGFHIS